MNVSMQDLNRWRAFAEQVRNACFNVRLAVSRGQAQQAKDALETLHEAACVIGKSMERAGADGSEGKPPAQTVPLELLDTPTNRQYLGALRTAYDAALARDRELYGPNIGTNGRAQVIELVMAGVELECCGPTGRLKE